MNRRNFLLSLIAAPAAVAAVFSAKAEKGREGYLVEQDITAREDGCVVEKSVVIYPPRDFLSCGTAVFVLPAGYAEQHARRQRVWSGK